jgi:hypothetical protein
MTALETFNQLSTDISRTLNSLLKVRAVAEIQNSRKVSGYIYNPDKHTREYWIALGQYSFSADLLRLAFIVNDRGFLLPDLLPTFLQTKQDLVNYYQTFISHRGDVIASFSKIIGNSNRLFSVYMDDTITMEQQLERVVLDIHNESLNLEFNYKQLITEPEISVNN